MGEVSSKDVLSPKTITYVDEEATEEQLEKTLESIENIYDQDPMVVEKFNETLDTFISSIGSYINDSENKELKKKEKMKLKDIDNPFSLDEAVLKEVVKVSFSSLYSFGDYVKNEVGLRYEDGVTESNLEHTRESLLSNSNAFIFPDILRKELYVKVLDSLEPNFSLNTKDTSKKKNDAIEDLDPIYKKITKGEAVIRKHEEIDETHIEKLKALGLTEVGFEKSVLIEFLPLIIFLSIMYHLFCSKFLYETMKNVKRYSITLMSLAIVAFLSNLLQGTDWYLLPILTLLIVFAVFWERGFLIVTSIFLGVLLSFNDMTAMVQTLIAGLSLTIFYNQFKTFTDAIKNGLILGVNISLASIVLTYTLDGVFPVDSILPFVFSGIIAGVVANGLIPLVESATGLATVFKLTELNKYDHPLLERLYNEARGTYEHSRNVAHLSTMASNRIGANTLLLKVASLFHDVGKMENAEYFIENSDPENNIHNHITPEEGAKVILNHPIRSAEICREEKLPEEVINLIERHHGDSYLNHFYQRAIDEGRNPSREIFRYQTKPPVTKEESILLLSDCVEAFSRVIEFDSAEELREKIDSVIEGKVKDGTLRKSTLTLEEMNMCAEEFCKALMAFSHKRVEYKLPKETKKTS